MVLFSQRRPPEMPDQSRAVLLAARVGAKAVSLHPQGLRSRDCCQPRPCGREVGGEAWLSRQVPQGDKKAESSTPPLYPLLGPVSSAQSTAAGPVQAFADSRAKVPLNENSAPACTGLH